jgi:hypothetical protein
MKRRALSAFSGIIMILVALLVIVFFVILYQSAPDNWQQWSIGGLLFAILYVLFARWAWEEQGKGRVPQSGVSKATIRT